MFFKNDNLLKKFFLIVLCAIAFYSFQKAFGSTNGNAEESMKKKVVTEFVTDLADYLIDRYQTKEGVLNGRVYYEHAAMSKGCSWSNMINKFIKELNDIKNNTAKSIFTLKTDTYYNIHTIDYNTLILKSNILKKDEEIKSLKEQLKRSEKEESSRKENSSKNEVPLSQMELESQLKNLEKQLKNITSTQKNEIEKIKENNTALKRVLKTINAKSKLIRR
ncbi:MAG: hypothetical protein LBI95_03295 [Holosporales bacterium]|jgi:hypothetical protein|nr:hypothetical protein [Holosporales bacterium]